MRKISLPFIFVVMLLPLLSMGSCTNGDVADSQTTDGDATTGGCLDDSDCESGFSCQNGDCVSDDTTLPADVGQGSAGTTDAADESSLTHDTVQGDDDEAVDADEGPAISDVVDDASGTTDTVQVDDDGTTDAVNEASGTDAAQIDAGATADAPDGTGGTDAVEADNDASPSTEPDADAESGGVDDGDLATCKKSCADDDLECTAVCGGSPLCLAQCAAAYTECNDACDAALGG